MLIVGIHEWGHYYFAKRAGILVREFAIGFGPKIFSYKKDETRFTFRLFPIGGYVRMAGEDPELLSVEKGQTVGLMLKDEKVTRIFADEFEHRTDCLVGTITNVDLEDSLQIQLDLDGELHTYDVHPQAMIMSKKTETQIAPRDRQFGSKSVGKRAMTIFAGPMMNFILAFALLLVFTFMVGVPTGEKTLLINDITADSAADEAGLQKNDVISSVNGEQFNTENEVTLREMIIASPEQEMEWVVIRNEQAITLTVTPKDVDGNGLVGITMGQPMKTPDIISGVQQSAITMGNMFKFSLEQVRELITFNVKLDELGGPVRITEETGKIYETYGLDRYIMFAAFFSLWLGVLNLVPFPVLDGSRLLFLGIEAVRRKPIDPSKENLVHLIGFAMLMVLMIVVTYNDLFRLFKG